MAWKEFEIKNFLGRQERVTPDKNSASSIINLDPRGGDQGSLLMRPKIENFLTPPTHTTLTGTTDLWLASMYITQLGSTPKEVTALIQKGTINRITGSGASVVSRNGIAIWTYPNYVSGVGWENDWGWLNYMVISKITYASSHIIQVYGFPSLDFSSGPNAVIYNVTQGKYATILEVDEPNTLYLSNNTFALDDTVIIMQNYMPLANDLANYSVTTAQISAHNVLNDLRIGFGGYVDRLGMGAGHRKKYFNIASVTVGGATNAQNLDNLISDPFNNKTENVAFQVTATRGGGTGQSFPYADFKSIYLQVTAVLDGYQEFVLPPVTTTCEIGDTFDPILMTDMPGASNRLLVVPKIHFALMNKRITHLKFYIAIGSGATGNYNRISSYYLVKTIEVANTTAAKTGATGTPDTWILGADSYLVLNTAGNAFEINYDMWLGNEGSLEAELGYKATTDFVKSWDAALMSGGRVYYLNPYIDQRYTNKIIRSAISGYLSFMYDVATGSDYSDAEQRDGDDVVGMELLPNLDIALFKQNSIQRLDTQTGLVFGTVQGVGCTSRKGIVNFRDKIIFPSTYGIYLFDGARATNISEGEVKSVYDAIADKTSIVAIRDELGNAYRFGVAGGEWIFLENIGWFYFTQAYTIVQYYISRTDNLIRFLDATGTMRKVSNTRAVSAPEGYLVVTLTTQVFDVTTIGEELKSSDRFLIGWISARYKSQRAITVTITKDNGQTITATLPIKSAIGHERVRLGIGHTTRNFKISLSASLEDGDTIFQLDSFAVEFDVLQRGQWG